MLLYAAFGATWIVFSDMLLRQTAADPEAFSRYQTHKGLLYVLLTALLVYVLVASATRRSMRARLDQAAAEQRLTLAAAGGRVGLWDWYIPTGEVSASPEWCRMLGYDPGEVGTDYDGWMALIHPDDRPGVRAALDAHLAGRSEVYEHEYRLLTRQRQWHWVFDRGRVIDRDGEGRALRASGVHLDINDRKRVEEELRSSRQRYLGLFDSALVGLYRTTVAEGRVVECNEEFARMFGYSGPEQMKQEMVFSREYVDPGVRQELIRLLKRDGVVRDFEASMRRRDGSHILVRYSARLDATGEYLEGFALDITDQRQREEQLRRLATAVEQAAEIILITDTSGRIEYVNPAFERITGFGREEVLGQTPRILSSGEHETAFYKDLWDTILDGRVWTGQLTNRKKDGSLYREEATISPIRDGEGQLVNFVAVKRDITAETELEAQLRQAQKMEAVGQLAGGVAHDFNNLLQAIQGFNELALSRIGQDDPLAEDLHQIERASQRASTLVRQLLTFSRRQIMAPEKLDLNEVIGDLMKMLRRVIGEHIHLDVHPGYDLEPVYADPGQIEQVLVNLAVNARDAMPEGGTIHIETSLADLSARFCRLNPWARPGRYVCMKVADTGGGIPEDVVEHIFEPFFTTKEVGKGTGLGLATVYGIVRQHEGLIDLQTSSGKGASFYVYLPLMSEPSGDSPQARTLDKSRGGHETILLAEDDELVRGLGQSVLSSAGYEVRLARDGQEAWDLFRQDPAAIDLALLDAVMPKRSGKALSDAIRGVRPDLPILFCSGYSFSTLGPELRPEDGLEVISKPYVPQELLRRVRHLLDARTPAP